MVASLLRLAVAAASGAVATMAAGADDASALVQVKTAFHPWNTSVVMTPADKSALYTPPSSPPPNCGCLTWKDVYTIYGVVCGETNEFIWLPKKGKGMPGLVKDECERFFTIYDDTHCIQTVFDGRFRDEWCYVSASCNALHGGEHIIGTNVSWKHCNDGQDKPLRKETPKGLLRIAADANMDPAYLMKMAYPVWDVKIPGLHWPGAQEALALRAHHGLDTEKADYLTAVEAENQAWILDSYDGHPPYAYVNGDVIVECTFSPWYFEHISDLKVVLANPSKISIYKCIQGACN